MENKILYNIFDTQEEANAAQAYDFNLFISDRVCDNAYCETTLCWDIPRETMDGRWAYIVCPKSDKEYQTVEFSDSLFPDTQSKELSVEPIFEEDVTSKT